MSIVRNYCAFPASYSNALLAFSTSQQHFAFLARSGPPFLQVQPKSTASQLSSVCRLLEDPVVLVNRSESDFCNKKKVFESIQSTTRVLGTAETQLSSPALTATAKLKQVEPTRLLLMAGQKCDHGLLHCHVKSYEASWRISHFPAGGMNFCMLLWYDVHNAIQNYFLICVHGGVS